jgi:hypothetical protein
MAYDEQLAARIRRILADEPDVTEQAMFGGMSFMLAGQLCCGVLRDELVVRLGQDGFADAVAEPAARPMDFTGRPSRGTVYVRPDALTTEPELRAWIARGVAYVRAHPKPAGRGRKATRGSH